MYIYAFHYHILLAFQSYPGLWRFPLAVEDELTRQGRLALEYVEKVRNSDCSGGTDEVLPVEFDHDPWATLADVPMRMANLLSELVTRVSLILTKR